MVPLADRKSIGLGFMPEEARHGFLLDLPASQAQDAVVMVSEHRDYRLAESDVAPAKRLATDPEVRVAFERHRWDALASAFWDDAGRRLKRSGFAVPRLTKRGSIPLHASLGKELCVLCWAVEDADPALIPEAIRNWEGLAPEERWWLYTMTAAATGQAEQRGVGWRKALRFALTENPLVKGEGLSPKTRKELLTPGQMSLF